MKYRGVQLLWEIWFRREKMNFTALYDSDDIARMRWAFPLPLPPVVELHKMASYFSDMELFYKLLWSYVI